MSLKVNNLGDRRQVLAALANKYAQTQHEQYTRCPRYDSANTWLRASHSIKKQAYS